MKSITVFCGSSSGNDPAFIIAARATGLLIAQKGITLVYGGGKIGIMGELADSVLRSGGKVIGVIPKFLRTKEVAHDGLNEMIVVDSMHERKTIMHELGEAVMALPGGFGTLEELFEMLTWSQLGLHEKPIGLLNVKGFYNNLLGFIEKMHREEFIRDEHRRMLLSAHNSDELLEMMEQYKAPEVKKWIVTDEQT